MDELDLLFDSLEVSTSDETFLKLHELLGKYQENPYLLDRKWNGYCCILQNLIVQQLQTVSSSGNAQQKNGFLRELDIIYTMMSLRGHKTISLFLRTSVDCLWIIQHLVDFLELTLEDSSSRWESRYVIFIWLASFLLVPFPLVSNRGKKSASAFSLECFSCVEAVALQALKEAGSIRKGASVFLAHFYSRKDVGIAAHLARPIPVASYERIGTLSMIKCYLLRCSHSGSAQLSELEALLAYSSSVIESQESFSMAGTLAKKLYLKIYSICVELAPSIAEREFGQAFLKVTLECLQCSDMMIRVTAANSFARLLKASPQGYRARLLASFLEVSVETGDFNTKNPQSLHGTLYALGELIRRNLFHPSMAALEFAQKVLPLVFQCIFFESRRSSVSPTMSAAVRDAACYVLWMAARFLTQKDFGELLRSSMGIQAIEILICLGLFDTDVNCRRAAAACLQLWIGKGQGFVPSGVEIIQILNYSSVSRKSICYSQLSVEIGLLSLAYASSLVSHLILYKRVHKDREVRILSSVAFGSLLSIVKETDEFPKWLKTITADLKSRDIFALHGSLFFCGALMKLGLGEESWKEPLKISGHSLLSSLGNELLFEGVVNYIWHFNSASQWVPSMDLWEDHLNSIQCLLDKGIKTEIPNVISDASFKALGSCLRNCPRKDHVDFTAMITNFFRKYRETRRSCYIWAVLSFPLDTLLLPCNFLLLSKLMTEDFKTLAAEGKRDFIFGCHQTLLSNHTDDRCSAFIQAISGLFGAILDDYTVDHRGDVGSYARLQCLELIQYLISECRSNYHVFVLESPVFYKILRIAFEKLDKLKEVAFRIVLQLQSREAYSHLTSTHFRELFSRIPSWGDSESLYSCGIDIMATSSTDDVATEFRKNLTLGLIRTYSAQIEYLCRPILEALFRNCLKCPKTSGINHFLNFILKGYATDSLPISIGKLRLLVYLLDKQGFYLLSEATISLCLEYLEIASRRFSLKNDFNLQKLSVEIYSHFGALELLQGIVYSSSIPKITQMAREHLMM